MSEKVIRFQGNEYLLIGDMAHGGSIATKEQFENGECSYAYLKPDGTVMRFGDSIGHRDEITEIGEYDAQLGFHSLIGVLTDKSWD